MMARTGFVQKGRESAADPRGKFWDILEFTISGGKYAVRMRDLPMAIQGKSFARIEGLERHRGLHLTGICGLAWLSSSGRAFNIELNDGERYTVPLILLRAVLHWRKRSAPVAKIPYYSRSRTREPLVGTPLPMTPAVSMASMRQFSQVTGAKSR